MPPDRLTSRAPSQDALDQLYAAEVLISVDPVRAADVGHSILARADDQTAPYAYLLIGKAKYHQGHLEEARVMLLQAKELLLPLENLPKIFELLLMLGRIYRDSGLFTEASEVFGEALNFAVRLNNAAAEIDVLNLYATTLSARGEYQRALAQLEQALKLARSNKLHAAQAHILSNLGTLQTSLANYPQALQYLLEASELLRTTGVDVRAQAASLTSLGQLYQELDEVTEAREFFMQAYKLGQEAHDLIIEAVSLNNLAGLDVYVKDWASARDNFQTALAITQRIGASQYVLDNLDGLGQVYVALGHVEEGVSLHLEALKLAQKLGDHEGEIDALLSVGSDYLVLRQPERAAECLQQGLTLAQGALRQRSVLVAHELLAQAYEQLGDLVNALEHQRSFHKVEKTVFNEENEQKTRRLTVQFGVEKMRHEAEESRLRTELMERARDAAEAIVRERTRELEEAHLEIVTRLAVAAEFHDDNTGEHTRRVGRNAAAIAYALGWPEGEVRLLYIAARLHDVGKLGVHDAILHKPARLTTAEMALMQQHTVIGAKILANGHSPVLKMAEEIALAHHERWDATGYPHGLAGEHIPLSARIVAVADVLDALIHSRPYKQAWSITDAFAELRRQSGRGFDPLLVDLCLKIFAPKIGLSPTEASSSWQRTLLELQQKVLRS